MRLSDGQVILSPSDLLRFQGCEHASALDLQCLRGEPLVPAPDTPDAVLLQKRGDEHERRHLERLAEAGTDIVVIERKGISFEDAARLTREAMTAGAGVIYQGALATGSWQGYSDFLERVDQPSGLGGFGYEVVDTKLKRRADPKHAIQLTLYSRAVAEMQGRMPVGAHIELGTGERASFPIETVRHYADRLAERLEAFVINPWDTIPEPVAACGLCRWRDLCAERWEAADSLTLVAGITRRQRLRLEAAGITTLAALASTEARVPRMQPETLLKLKTQARLQFTRRAGGPPAFELREIESGRGLARLPAPSSADLFFDMEGDPFVDGGLEYLFGVYTEADGKSAFSTWWAHDADRERAAVAAVLDFFMTHLAVHRDAFIYHYNHYEVTALKRLTARYGVGEFQLDHLLRTGRFVDLYRVVQQGLTVSEKGYSLKDLEAFYMEKRVGDVATAGESIVAYEEWRETGEQRFLDDIARYNEVDCRSTKLLRDWLVGKVRPSDIPWHTPAVEEVPPTAGDPEREALRVQIHGARERLGDRVADLLFELNGFHRRADKPSWWEYFDRQDREAEELIDDPESLAGLVALQRSDKLDRTYQFPPQETKMRVGAKVSIRGLPGTATIVDLNRARRQITVKFPKKIGVPPDRCDLIPGTPIPNNVLRDAVRRVTTSLTAGENRYSAIDDFLNRRQPRLAGSTAGAPIVAGTDLVPETVVAVRALDSSCLPIQGPPGTGKTYVSSRAILDLVRRGHRIAVSSNAHKAIDNLLVAVAARAREAGLQVNIAKKISSGDELPDDPMITTATENADVILRQAQVVGGTAWLFARPEFDQAFSHLFVDEAGQVSIANLLATAAVARNIVLVGDQMQLPQPIQGIHPGDTGLSTLEYLLNGSRTVRPDQGVFLPVSRRMHPHVCELVSLLAYEGRVISDEGAARHRLDFRDNPLTFPPHGVAFIDVEHHGNGQTSEEEADRLVHAYQTLLGASFTDRDGNTRNLGIGDILVVSPYNAQVNLLTDRLPPGARVGTVDRFQGQEAPACLVSMATSSGEEMPRDIAFLFSLNRLNVAISRAQALAVIFCSPRLLDIPCSTLEDLQLVNALCAVRSYALAASQG